MAARRFISNLLAARRRWAVARRFQTSIPSSVYIAAGAHFDFNPDGFCVGGELEIGRNVRVCRGAIIAPYGGSIVLEDNVYIGPYAILYGHGGLHIGRDSMIAAHSVVVATNHKFDILNAPIAQQAAQSLGIEIGSNVWIGAGAKILDGVQLSDGCVIGAGAVVTNNMAPNVIAAGVPARVIGVRGMERGSAGAEDGR